MAESIKKKYQNFQDADVMEHIEHTKEVLFQNLYSAFFVFGATDFY